MIFYEIIFKFNVSDYFDKDVPLTILSNAKVIDNNRIDFYNIV